MYVWNFRVETVDQIFFGDTPFLFVTRLHHCLKSAQIATFGQTSAYSFMQTDKAE